MKKFIFLLIVLLFAVVIGLKIAQDPGYALFVYQQWSVEMPLWLSFVLAIFVLVIFYFFVRLIDNFKLYGNYVRVWNRQRKRNYAHKMLCRGLIELIEGHWQSAEKYLLLKVKRSETPLVNYLMAAKAAQAQGNHEKRDEYLRLAHSVNPDAKIAIGLTKAQLQLDQQQLEQALATLKHLKQVSPKHAYILQALYKLNLELKDWVHLKEMLPALHKAKFLNAEQYNDLEVQVFEGLLLDALNIEALKATWKAASRQVRKQSDVVFAYAKKLLGFNQVQQAEVALADALSHHWSNKLVMLYAEINLDLNKQLKTAQHWTKQHGQSAALNFALAKFSQQLQLWGQARSYYEASVRIDPNPTIYLHYVEFLAERNETANALKMSLEALRSQIYHA